MEYPESKQVFWFTEKILKCGFQWGHAGPDENEASRGYTSSTPLNEACYTISYSMPAARLNKHKKVNKKLCRNSSQRDGFCYKSHLTTTKVQSTNMISAPLCLKLCLLPNMDSCQSHVTIIHSNMSKSDNTIRYIA